MKKFIVLLSAKRTGSTTIFRIFQKHPDFKIFNENQKIENWESQYWSLAVNAIAGFTDKFEKRLRQSIPSIKFPKIYDKSEVFKLHDEILNNFKDNVFDKSPQYLGNYNCLELLLEYARKNKNIYFISIIRNPLDSITSQHELWREYTKEKDLKKREHDWLKQYQHLKNLINNGVNIKQIRYENLVDNPENEVKDLCNYCEIKYYPEIISHIKKKSVGRYQATLSRKIKRWVWSNDFEKHLIENLYHPSQLVKISNLDKLKIVLSSIKRFIPLFIKKKLRNR
jgi:hypothetical protein